MCSDGGSQDNTETLNETETKKKKQTKGERQKTERKGVAETRGFSPTESREQLSECSVNWLLCPWAWELDGKDSCGLGFFLFVCFVCVLGFRNSPVM